MRHMRGFAVSAVDNLQAPKGVKERVKSPYRNASRYMLAACVYRITLTHTHPFIRNSSTLIYQRSTIGQSVFCIFLMVAGCYVILTIALHALLCFQDATIRPVLKHGPRSSTGLRVVEFISHNTLAAKRKQTRTM